MNFATAGDRTEVPFAPTFIHRLFFTDDVLGADVGVLRDVFEPSGDRPARVQFWIDDQVLRGRPELPEVLHGWLDAPESTIQRAGEIQIITGGEAVKNDLQMLERMLKAFYEEGLDRRSYVAVIGGGAVLDAVGFAAAVAHRGLRLVRFPTTTLGQADSGVGVKNAVNLFGKKNWLGSFAVPWAVINDAALLKSLPDRDFLCGFSEAVKVSLLKDSRLFDTICRDARKIRSREMSAALPIIRASAERHRDHITLGGDPFETREARPLDFGHWSAHRMETLTEFRLRHGEAVAIGVAIDTIYSSFTLGFPEHEVTRVLNALEDLGFNLRDPVLDNLDALLDGLEEFRQHLGGRLTITLLQDVGVPIDVHEMDRSLVRKAIETLQSRPHLTQSSTIRPTIPTDHKSNGLGSSNGNVISCGSPHPPKSN